MAGNIKNPLMIDRDFDRLCTVENLENFTASAAWEREGHKFGLEQKKNFQRAWDNRKGNEAKKKKRRKKNKSREAIQTHLQQQQLTRGMSTVMAGAAATMSTTMTAQLHQPIQPATQQQNLPCWFPTTNPLVPQCYLGQFSYPHTINLSPLCPNPRFAFGVQSHVPLHTQFLVQHQHHQHYQQLQQQIKQLQDEKQQLHGENQKLHKKLSEPPPVAAATNITALRRTTTVGTETNTAFSQEDQHTTLAAATVHAAANEATLSTMGLHGFHNYRQKDNGCPTIYIFHTGKHYVRGIPG